jgi:hypothetical protein
MAHFFERYWQNFKPLIAQELGNKIPLYPFINSDGWHIFLSGTGNVVSKFE